jgi:hypothetical protein
MRLPLQQLLSFDGRNLHTPPLNSVQQDLDWGGKIVQLNRNSEFSRPASQRVSFRPSPSTPFDYHGETQGDELLAKLPLEALNLLAHRFIPDIQRKSIHPFVGTEADRARPGLKLLRMCRFPRTRQAAHDNQFRTRVGCLHIGGGLSNSDGVAAMMPPRSGCHASQRAVPACTARAFSFARR